MPFTEHEVIEGFDEFRDRIEGLEADAEKSKEPLFILFIGSDGPDGKSWCPDSVAFVERVWTEYKSKKGCPQKGRFVTVKVGGWEYWKDKNCPFRANEPFGLGLSFIPTLIKWNKQRDTSQRLSNKMIEDLDLLAMLFEED